MKECNKCYKQKDKTDFYGRAAMCKVCHSAYMKLYRASKYKAKDPTGYNWYWNLWQ